MKALNSKIVLDAMTPMQKMKYDALNRPDRLAYIMSFLGMRAESVGYGVESAKIQALGVSGGEYGASKLYADGELKQFFSNHIRSSVDAGQFKTPLLKTNDYIGVEIECLLPRDSFDNDYECSCNCEDNCGCGNDDCESYLDNCDCGGSDDGYISGAKYVINRLKIKGIQVVTDSSLTDDTGNYFGCEIKILFREGDYSSLAKICAWLDDKKAIVNKTCGLHVHLDARKYDSKHVRIFAQRFASALPYINKMVPKSRVANSFCKDGLSFNDRYSAVNGDAYSKHKTIEVRLHTGSTNFSKIKNWVDLLTLVKKCDRLSIDCPDSLADFFAAVGVSVELEAYCIERMTKFNPGWLDAQGVFRLVDNNNSPDEESEAA